jgi:outer membrane protein OmpA-like peptidoglycan-associated protein
MAPKRWSSWGACLAIVAAAMLQQVQFASAAEPPGPPADSGGMPHSYAVYFHFDQWIPPDEAKAVIEAAAQDAKTDPYAQITLVGYSDTAETPVNSRTLSRRRTEEVLRELLAKGALRKNISISWKGATDLPAPIVAGVREPLDRVVFISFDE